MQGHTKKIIHSDQISFLPEMPEWLDIHKSLTIVYHMKQSQGQKPHDHHIRHRKTFDKSNIIFR